MEVKMLWICKVLMLVQYVQSLKYDINDLSGTIKSPNEKDTYPNEINITWSIKVNEGFKISFYFSEFDLEDSFDEEKGGACVYDYLQIEEEDKVIHKFCGNQINYPIDAPRIGEVMKSTGNSLILNFITDYSNEDPMPKGFKAHYKEIDRDECHEMLVKAETTFEDWDKLIYCNHHCHNVPGSYYCSCEAGFLLHSNTHTCINDCTGKTLTSDNGTISSSKYSNVHSKLANCDWTIQRKNGIHIELKFVDDFDIEEHIEDGCVYDWIQYEDEDGTKSERFCGKEKPNKGEWINTNSHVVKVTFQSDLTIEKAGFKLIYRSVRARCNKKLKAPTNGVLLAEDKKYYEFEDVVKFKCNVGYRLKGRSRIMCGSNGRWEVPEPKCQIKKCKHPAHLDKVQNGRIKDDVISLTYGSNVTVLCFVWYEMTSGISVWGCEDDEKWHGKSEIIAQNENGNIPECKPICGLKGNQKIRENTYNFGDVIDAKDDPEPLIGVQIIDGKKAEVGEWPWMAFVDLYSAGLGEATDFCGGSLITPKTVVTAAHCTSIAFRNDILVYIGVTDRRNAAANKDLQVFSVVEMYEHENYSLSFDNDIAVLILNASVRLGKYARPVCLPRSPREQNLTTMALSSNLNFQRRGVIAGWGYTVYTELEKTLALDLMMTRIPPIERKKCNESIEHDDLVITDNMLCAGFLDGGRDSCQGDSGGPFMFKDPARSKWFLNGIVSFGSSERCGDRTFGIYTIVSRYISWIETFMRE